MNTSVYDPYVLSALDMPSGGSAGSGLGDLISYYQNVAMFPSNYYGLVQSAPISYQKAQEFLPLGQTPVTFAPVSTTPRETISRGPAQSYGRTFTPFTAADLSRVGTVNLYRGPGAVSSAPTGNEFIGGTTDISGGDGGNADTGNIGSGPTSSTGSTSSSVSNTVSAALDSLNSPIGVLGVMSNPALAVSVALAVAAMNSETGSSSGGSSTGTGASTSGSVGAEGATATGGMGPGDTSGTGNSVGGGSTSGASSSGMGGASEGSVGSTAADAASPDGPDGSNASAADGGGGGGGGGGCFITTAVLKNTDEKDDGKTLSLLRKFRDTNMLKDKEKSREIKWYYENAPLIVKKIDAQPNAGEIYQSLYDEYIKPAADAVEKGNDKKAYEIYKQGILRAVDESKILENRYAGGGMANVAQEAKGLAALGRDGDTMLVHMAPSEVRGLQSMAERHGTSLSINPNTGLPEAKKLKDWLAPVAPFLPFIIPGAGTVLGGLAGQAAASGVLAGLAAPGKGINFSEGIKTGLMAYGLGSMYNSYKNVPSGTAIGPGNQPVSNTGGLGGPTTITTDLSGGPAGVDVGGDVLSEIEAASAGTMRPVAVEGSSAAALQPEAAAGKSSVTGFERVTGISPTMALIGGNMALGAYQGNKEIEAFKAAQAQQQAEDEEDKRRARESFNYSLGRVQQPVYGAGGGLVALARGGMTYMEAGGTTGPTGEPRMVAGTGDGMSDSVPATIEGVQEARLANDEFVIPADVVADIGNGSSSSGAKKLYDMMDRIRKARHGTTEQPPEIRAEKYMPA